MYSVINIINIIVGAYVQPFGFIQCPPPPHIILPPTQLYIEVQILWALCAIQLY